MLSDLDATAAHLEKATVPEDVFGKLDGHSEADRMRALALQYRRIVQVVHPDRNADDSDRAHALFVKVTAWKTQAEQKIRSGTYGDGKAVDPPPPSPPPVSTQIITTPKRTYVVSERIAEGDLADLYACTYTEGKGTKATTAFTQAVFKVAQSPADNDLLENESKTLAHLYPEAQAEEKFYRYLLKPLDTFVLKGAGGTARRVNVLQRAEGYVTLADIQKAYPKGLDFRDVVWMFKRLLAGLGFVHNQKKVVHGAVLPTHVMVHPTGHGARIVDWCYSVRDWDKRTATVKALSSPYRAFYAPEILKKAPPSPATDIYMAAKCAVALLGGDVATNLMPPSVPKQLQAFLGGCLLGAQGMRPDNAWTLHEELDELLLRVVGKPTYRPLAWPAPIT